jgi:hypothetical protein
MTILSKVINKFSEIPIKIQWFSSQKQKTKSSKPHFKTYYKAVVIHTNRANWFWPDTTHCGGNTVCLTNVSKTGYLYTKEW